MQRDTGYAKKVSHKGTEITERMHHIANYLCVLRVSVRNMIRHAT